MNQCREDAAVVMLNEIKAEAEMASQWRHSDVTYDEMTLRIAGGGVAESYHIYDLLQWNTKVNLERLILNLDWPRIFVVFFKKVHN